MDKESEWLVSVIVPSLNQGAVIEQTIQSVLEQTYPHIEIIVVDGGSTDETLNILKQFKRRIHWISESDNGQADAINKGFRMARGNIFAWLNADDLYLPDAIEQVVNYFSKHPTATFVYGDVIAIDYRGKEYGLRPFIQQTDYHELVHSRNRIVQPATFWRVEVWYKVGALDDSLHYVMDYDYWIRIAKVYSLHYLPRALAKERLSSQTKSSRGSLNRIYEIERIARKHGRDKLPSNFYAEASATYLLAGIRHVLQLRFAKGYLMLHRSLELKPPLLKLMRYLIALSFLGHHISWAWLILTKLFGKK